MKLYSYNNGSASAKALAAALGIKMIKHEGRNIEVDVLLNWGASGWDRDIDKGRVINNPVSVGFAVNKLKAFTLMNIAGVNIPKYTSDSNTAYGWWVAGEEVVIRTKLNGHSGEGIIMSSSLPKEDEAWVTNAPLYTQYVKKSQEYRCHVMHGEVFFIQRKARKLEVEDEKVNWQVRNLAGGFIYANQDVDLPEIAKQEAVSAITALGLDFGAVDLIYGTDKRYYVLEVNTACGLAGTTLDKYVEQFKRYEL